MKTYVLKKSGATPDFKVDYAAELNEEQLDVVAKGDGACLVLAGAGSGKTRTIVYRVAYLLERGVAPDRILLLTFTNKAAREMLERAEALVGAELRGLWGGTFHHVCHRILRESCERAGLRQGFTILDSEDAKDLLKLCVRECGLDPKARRFPAPSVLLDVVSYARNAALSVADALERKHPTFLELLKPVEDVADCYEAKKRASNAVDFDDLLLLVVRLFRGDPAALERYASRFHHLLVDEFQDINPLQAELVRLLASVHGNVLAVGDDAQSIYSFRGADIRNILSFPTIFPGAKTFRLETNYRSTPQILEVANDVIAKNANQFPKELRAVKKPYAKPALVTAVSAAQEAEFTAQRILELRDEGLPLKEIAVLFRATFHSQALEFELMKRGIPYDYRGGLKFFDRAHVKDALAFLKIMANKDDAVAWMRVLSLQVGIGGVTAGKLYDRVRTLPSLDEIDERLADGLSAKASAGWAEFLDVFRELCVVRTSPSELLRAVAASDYRAYLENEYPDWRDRLSDVEELADFASTYESLEAFLADLTLENGPVPAARRQAPGTPSADDEDRLVLSTIHQAKGLEWEAVFLIHLSQGDFPNKRAVLDPGSGPGAGSGLEEERRLFYVAVTRARRELTFSYPMTAGYGDFSLSAKSEFLEELAPHLVEETRIEEVYDDLPTKDLLKDISEY
jgi:DNA helicase-2/ATP-dependent DNA helicase PcrA